MLLFTQKGRIHLEVFTLQVLFSGAAIERRVIRAVLWLDVGVSGAVGLPQQLYCCCIVCEKDGEEKVP